MQIGLVFYGSDTILEKLEICEERTIRHTNHTLCFIITRDTNIKDITH